MDDAPVRATEPANNASFVPLSPGRGIVFCQGLGGRSVNPNSVCLTAAEEASVAAAGNPTAGEKHSCPWWALGGECRALELSSLLFSVDTIVTEM